MEPPGAAYEIPSRGPRRRPLSRRRFTMRKTFILVLGLICIIAAAFVFILTSEGGGGSESYIHNSEHSSDAVSAAVADARAGDAAKDKDKSDRESAARSELINKDFVKITGRVVFSDGTPPPEKVAVRLLTNDNELNSSNLISALGGRKEWLRILKNGELESRSRAAGVTRNGFETISAADGKFEIAAPKIMKRFMFEVEGDFVTYNLAEWFDYDPKNNNKELTLVCERAGLVEVTIEDSAGSPAAGAWASYAPPNPRWAWNSMTTNRALTADASGRVFIRGVPLAGGSFRAVAAGCALGELKLSGVIASQTTKLKLQLPAELRASGIVVNEKGDPFAGALLTLTARNGWSDLGVGRARSGGDGKFTVTNLGKGAHYVNIQIDGYLLLDGPKELSLPLDAKQPELKYVVGVGSSIAGKITDETGAALAGARVVASSDYAAQSKDPEKRKIPYTTQESQSAADGTYKIAGLGDGVFVVTAIVDGRGVAFLDNIPKNSENINITVAKGVVVSGRVTDKTSGEAVSGANLLMQVSARGPNAFMRNRAEGTNNRTRAGDDGSFAFEPAQAGKYEIIAAAPGSIQKTLKDVEVAVGDQGPIVNIQLESGCVVRGKVTEEGTGAPIAGAIVSPSDSSHDNEDILRGEYLDWGMNKNRKTTGLDGTYELRGVEPSKYKITATDERFIDGKTELLEIGAGAVLENINITMSRGGAVEGDALDEQGSPIIGEATASFEGNDEKNYQRARSTVINEKGYFKMEGLQPGRWLVRAKPFGKDKGVGVAGYVNIELYKTARVQFYNPKGGVTIRGVVTRGGAPAQSASVRANYKQKVGGDDPLLDDRRGVGVREDGTFTMEHMPAGEVELHIRYYDKNGKESGQNRWIEKVTFPDSGTLNLTIAIPLGGEIRGRVTSRADGRPLAGVSIIATPARDPQSQVRLDAASGRSDEKGYYSFQGLLPALYTISARPSRREPAQSKLLSKQLEPVSVVNETSVVADIALESGGALIVELTDETGAPIANQRVVAELVNGKSPLGADIDEIRDQLQKNQEEMQQKMRDIMEMQQFGGDSRGYSSTEAGGIARFDGIAPGKYIIRVDRKGYSSRWSEPVDAVSGSEAKITFQIDAGAPLHISTVDSAGRTLPFVSLTISAESGRSVFSKYTKTGESSADVRILPGKYKINARSGSSSAELNIQVDGTAEQQAQVRFP